LGKSTSEQAEMRTYKFTGSKEFEVQARSLKKALRSAETQATGDKRITGEWTNKRGNEVVMHFDLPIKRRKKK
jgi:hypothetical protein